MRLLHIIASVDPRFGGPGEGVNRMGEALRADGHDQEILTLDSPDEAWIRSDPGTIHALGHIRLPGNGLLSRVSGWLRYSPAAVRWLRQNVGAYDGVVVHGLWNFSTRLAALGLRTAKVPYVVFPHGMLDPWFADRYSLKHLLKRGLWWFNEGPLLRDALAVAFTCEQERRMGRGTFRPWQMREAVVGFGTRSAPDWQPAMGAAFRGQVPTLEVRSYLLFIGRLHEVKGCDVLIESFAKLAPDHPGTDLVIAGPGPDRLLRSLQHQAAALGIGDRVHWSGMLSGDAKWGAIHGCEALVLASHHENFGVVVAEAMACGRPVIISDKVAIHEEIASAGAGVIGEDLASGFAVALGRFLALPPPERAAMGARGRALFEARFDMAATARALIDLFDKACGGQASSRQANIPLSYI